MADISITKYKNKVTKPTASPSNPGYPTSDPIDPVNPPASGTGGGGVNTFLQLTDTPALYTGQGAKAVSVKSDETGLEFIDFPTVTGGDEPAVKTTASADQTLPSGVLTILDYDSTLTNNATLIYSVGTDGRITVSDNGVFDITAGVVIEANALTALESAFLGIFRNGNLIAISSINTTIAAGSSSGLSCSTQIALLSGDIIDCRALVTSVGGVAPGLARRLGTLLGANATQVNSLAIVKCISNGQSFLQLSDTPASYTGQAGLFPRVNSGETGLEFASAIEGTGTTNYIPKFTASGTIGDSRLIDDANGVYNTDKDNSTFFGYQAGLNDDAFDNRNAGFGYQAMSSITSGTDNVAFGYKAMSALTNGISNTAIGQDSMELATNINYAVAIGDSALRVGNGAYNLVAIGVDSARNATTAASFVAVGRSAGLSTTTGQGWTAIGDTAGSSNTTGQYWTALGGLSGFRNATGSSWITLGYFAGAQLASLANATSFSNSIYIGNYTKVSANGVTNEIVIGDQAVGNGSNTVTIGNSSTTKNYFFGRVQHGDAVNSNESATLGQVNSIVGSATFIGLTDTPASYTGQSGLFPRVNSGESALEFFNPLSLPLTGYTVGSNTALADTDTILGAFGKVQGQINAKIGGTITSGQVAFGTGTGTIGGNADLVWNNSAKFLSINGKLTVGTLVQPDTINIYSLGNLSGGTSVIGVLSQNQIQSVVTSSAVVFRSSPSTQATTFTLSQITHFLAQPSTFGAGSTVTSQNGFFVASNLTGATNNYAFRSVLNSGTGRWNLFMDGTANNYLAGNLWIGTTSGTNTLDVNGTARIRTLSNATGDFVTASATGVLQKRTASETLADIGGIGGTITSGQVAFGTGTGTIGGNAGLTWDNTNKRLGLNTSTPERKLHLISNSSDGGIKVQANLFGNGARIEFLNTASGTNAVSSFIGQRVYSSVNLGIEISDGTNNTFYVNTAGLQVGILTNSPTNTLDVNGTARIRSLTGTTGYLPLLSSTGVMGQSVAYNADTGIVINGTTLPTGAVLSVNGLSYFTNYATAGAYDKLAIDFGENRGFGYDGSSNEIFVKGTTTVPVKIDTDAPTDSFNILSTGGIKMANIPSGTPATSLGLDSNNELVKSTAVSATSGTFTPVLTDSASGATFTTTAVGKYYKVGNRVDVYISFDISAITGTATGDIEITDLPFSIDYGLNSTIQLMLNYSPPTADRGVEYIVPLLSSGTSFKLSYINGNGFVLAGTLASSSDIILTASYITT